MNNLLFTALLIALLYYFFYYLLQKKNLSNPPLTKPLTHSQFIQTEPTLIENKELEELKTKNQELTTKLKTNQQDYQHKVKDQQTQITNLQSQIRDLVKRPLKPTNSKFTQADDKSLENTLDTLIKSIQELNNEL